MCGYLSQRQNIYLPRYIDVPCHRFSWMTKKLFRRTKYAFSLQNCSKITHCLLHSDPSYGFWTGGNDLAIPRKWVWASRGFRIYPFVNWRGGRPEEEEAETEEVTTEESPAEKEVLDEVGAEKKQRPERRGRSGFKQNNKVYALACL